MKILLAMLITICLISCSSTLDVKDATNTTHGDKLDGIPFRISENYILHLYQKDKSGNYHKIHENREALPNPDTIYVMGLDGGAMANQSLNVVFTAYGTISTFNLSPTQQGTAALDNLGTEMNDLATELRAQETAEASAAATAATNIENAITTRNTAELSELQLDALLKTDNPSAETVLTKRQELLLNQYKANVAALKAGMLAPYPDIDTSATKLITNEGE